MGNLIFDAFCSAERFKTATSLDIVVTKDNNLEEGTGNYDVLTIQCCSGVKDTDRNWFYLIKKYSNEDLVLRWINEISPMFPEFNIKVIYVNSDRFKDRGRIMEDRGITVNLPLSDYSMHYGITNKARYPRGNFYKFPKLLDNIIGYILSQFKETKDEVSIENIINLINKFFNSELFFETKKEIFEKYPGLNERVVMVADCGSGYRIDLRAIDYLGSGVDNSLKEYAIKVITSNIGYIRKRLGDKVDKLMCIQALYGSHATLGLMKYIAHILIRAALSSEGPIDFIKQYFYIKEKTPDLYFWNRIFLTQFGFNFNNYFWFTSYRTFKFTTKEKFTEASIRHKNDFANRFFNTFGYIYREGVLKKLKELYLKEEFDEFIKICSTDFSFKIVRLKDKYKDRFINLKLSKSYITNGIAEEGNCYLIMGDDYKVRKYRKDRFIFVGLDPCQKI